VAFNGWPPSAIEFYEGLEADNSKSYWLAHKHVYEQDVEGPMLDLLEELTDEFGEIHLMRPYRDIRFSADKSPYKTAIAATIGACYVRLSAEGLLAGAGTYHMETARLDRYREAVDREASGRELEHIVAGLGAAGLGVHAFESLKTAPRGYPKDHPRVELLRFKGIVTMKDWPVAGWLSTPAATRRVVDVFRAATPLVDWLSRYVEPAGA
jgi:uncharacterized protein (TIGR02453 family)